MNQNIFSGNIKMTVMRILYYITASLGNLLLPYLSPIPYARARDTTDM